MKIGNQWLHKIGTFFSNNKNRIEICMLSFGLFPGVWILNADFSEHCLFHLHRQVGASRIYTHIPAYEDGTECFETSAFKIQTPGNNPIESIKLSEHGESLKSRIEIVSTEQDSGFTYVIENVNEITNFFFQAEVIVRSLTDWHTCHESGWNSNTVNVRKT